MNLNPNASLKQLEASDPGATVWVNANAGSGKTHVLVDRVIRLMLQGTDPSRIMCLTFTKAAAAEMANRLFERLSTWIAIENGKLSELLISLGSPEPDTALLERARQLFTRALETPGGLKIQTIHAFCERVLQLFPVEAGIVPHFTMLDDRQSREMLAAARNDVLARAQADGGSPPGAALLDIANRVQPDAFDALLTQVLSKRANLRAVLDPETGLDAAELFLRQHLALAPGVTADGVRHALTIDIRRYREFADALETGSAADKDRAAELRITCSAAGATLLDLHQFYLTQDGTPRKSVATKAVRQYLPWLDDFIAKEQNRLVESLGKLGDLDCLGATLSVLRLGSAIVAAFENAKRQKGCYDFDDLIIKTGELLHERPDAAWVLYKLDGGIEHMLVDEAQDTSPMQWQIVRSLTEEFFAGEGRHGRKNRTVFVVGDRKQSIYSFQGADPNVFEAIHDEFKDHAQASGHAFRDVDLTVSFRSAPEILQAVDWVFDSSSAVRKGLDGATPRDWHHESNRRTSPGVVEIWPLTEPVDANAQDPWQAPVDREPSHSPRRRLAQHLAQTIKGWIGKRTIPALGRAVQPGDILILVRQRNSFFDAMIRALWNEKVPVAGADRLKLSQNIAVLDLMALAQFCIMPEDDHALACILKSPIFARPLSEDELLAIAANRKSSLWDSLKQRQDTPYGETVGYLLPLVEAAPAARPFEFVSQVLNTARMRFLARLGSEANDAIDALLDRALDYEEASGTSLAGFCNWFTAGEVEIRRDMEPGSNQVRIMTVHGAKGLEAPIVILPDTTSGPEGKSNPLLMLDAGNGNARVPLWAVPKLYASKTVQDLKDKQKESQSYEYQRLLYVAMTRARDELYVCGYTGARAPSPACWYNTIADALKPRMAVIDAGWRLGAAPVWTAEAAHEVATETERLPGWISETFASSPGSAERRPQRQVRSYGRVARGILIHRILQQLPDLPELERPAYIGREVQRAQAEPRLADELTALIAHPVFGELLSADGVSEVPLMIEVPGLAPQRRRIDRLVINDGGILLADYKSDREVPADVGNCNPEYLLQMAAYRDALRKIHRGTPLRVCLLWTEAPSLMFIPDDMLDRVADQHSVTYP